MPTIATWNTGFPISFCDEEGNYYGTRFHDSPLGLIKRDPAGNILWSQPNIEPFLVQQDGSAIGFMGNRTSLVLIDPNGNIIKTVPADYQAAGYHAPIAHRDGGVTTGKDRWDNELILLYSRPEERIMDTQGNVWILIHENGYVYVGRLDDAGNEVERIKVGDYTSQETRLVTGIDLKKNLYVSRDHATVLSPDGQVLFQYLNGTYPSRFTLVSDGLSIFERYEYPYWYDIGLTPNFQQLDLAGGYWDPDYPQGSSVSKFDGSGNVLLYFTHHSTFGTSWTETYRAQSGEMGISVGTGAGPDYRRYASRFVPHPDGWMIASEELVRDGGVFDNTYFYAPPEGFIAHADLKDGNGGVAGIQYRYVVAVAAGDTVTARRITVAGQSNWKFYTAPGNYRVLVSSPFTLTEVVYQNVSTGFPDVYVLLPAGDIVRDNQINIYDLNAEFMDPIDLNNDGEITSADILIIFRNFGLRGDE